MAAPQGLHISMSCLSMTNGNGFKAMTPDKDGVFKGVPIMILGKPTDNRTEYDPQSAIKAISGEQSLFRNKLIRGCAEGEVEHPDYTGLNNQEKTQRALRIDRTKISHIFTSVYTKQVGDNVVIYADVKPFGPFGSFLQETFESSLKNVAFSIRTISRSLGRSGGIDKRYIMNFVTADLVSLGGYMDMGKQLLDSDVAEESFQFGHSEDISFISKDELETNNDMKASIGMESVTDQQLLDIFEADRIQILDRTYTGISGKALVSSDGRKESIFHNVFGR